MYVCASRHTFKFFGSSQAAAVYEKAAEILLRSDNEVDRPELLSLVQVHHAQVLYV